MIVERQKGEIVIRIPENIDSDGLQNFINYLKVKTIVAKSTASASKIAEISTEINKTWWEKNKNRFVK